MHNISSSVQLTRVTVHVVSLPFGYLLSPAYRGFSPCSERLEMYTALIHNQYLEYIARRCGEREVAAWASHVSV